MEIQNTNESDFLGSNNPTASPTMRTVVPLSTKDTFSLRCLFQIVTGCGVFFAFMRYSPVLAIVGTLLITPAIIRTAFAAELYRNNGLKFDLKNRMLWFTSSLGVVSVTFVFAACVFALISLFFGFLGVLFSLMITGDGISMDAAVVGTASGTIWGFAGAIIAVGYSAMKTWMPVIRKKHVSNLRQTR